MTMVETSNIKVGVIGGSECAWQGCTNRFEGEMPDLWLNLLTWWSPWPKPDATIAEVASSPYCKRDAVLCPQHAAELERLLKDIGNALKDVVGSA